MTITRGTTRGITRGITIDSIRNSVYLDDFIFVVKTDNSGTSTTKQFTFPTQSSGTYNCIVHWGDDTTSRITTYNDAAWTHTYSPAGTYTIRISGQCEGIEFGNGGDKDKLLDIKQWGALKITSAASGAFRGCTNLTTISAIDTPDFSLATNINSFLRDCYALATIPALGDWVLPLISQTFNLWMSCTNFNEPSIVNLNTTGIQRFTNWFFGNTSLTRDVSGFDTSSANRVDSMFNGAINMDFDYSGYSFENVTNAATMFNGVTLSTSNYDNLLVSIESQAVQNGVTFDGGNSTYSTGAAATARAALIADHSWTITDGGPA